MHHFSSFRVFLRVMKAKRITFLFLLVVGFLGAKVNAQDPGYWRSDTFCLNTSIQYTFTITINNQPPQFWAWSMPGANPDTFYSTTSDQSPPFSFSKAGYYKVVLTLKLADGRDTSVYSDVLALDPNPPISTIGNDTTYCGDFTRSLDAGNPGSNYLWSTGANTQTIQVNQAGTYTVDVSNACYSGTFSINLTKRDIPTLDLGPDGFVCKEAPKTLVAGDKSYFYEWQDGSRDFEFIVSEAGTYSVTKTDANGCSNSDEVTYLDSCPPDLYVPSAFTPNNNGLNETISPYTNGIRSLEWYIYDRWGELIFSTDQVGVAWDGTYRGKACPDGVYIWYLKAYDSNYRLHIQKGTFVLYQ